jgi:diguanylate cyclase
MSEKKPFEIARETLKQLTVRKLPPTPINYQTLYNEIAGIPQAPQKPCLQKRQASKSSAV